MLVCVGGREKKSSSLFIRSLEWVWKKDMLFLQSRILISIKRICRIRRVLDSMFPSEWFFFLVIRIFFFFFVIFLLFFSVVFLDDFLFIPRRRLRCTIHLSWPTDGNWSAADFADILYRSLHQGINFFFGFSLQITSRFCELIFDRFLYYFRHLLLPHVIPARKIFLYR